MNQKKPTSTASEKIFRALDAFKIETPSWGYADTGTRFGKFFQDAAAWFIEPAAQFSGLRIDRSDYLTGGSCPLSVHNVNSTIIRLRAALRAGRVWRPAGAGVLELAGHVAYVRERGMGGDVCIGAETWRPNLDGNRGEAGVSVIWRPRGKFQLYFDYEAAYGDNYKKLWDVSLGARFMF